MLIAIEAQRIFRKHKHGMDVVALELLRQLQQLDKENEYILLAANGPDRSCLSANVNFAIHTIPGFTYAGWEQVSLPAALKKMRPSLIHCTANTAPFKCPVPLVLTLHDIIYLEETNFKGSAYQNFGNLYRKAVVPSAIKNAAAIITVSEFEKRTILENFPAAQGKLHVIPNGVAKRFNNNYPAAQIELFKAEYKLPGNFILLLGNTAPKKNTSGAIKAYEHYCSIASSPLPLVIVDFDGGTLRNKNIIFPGYVPFEKMPLLYNAAKLLLYPSLRESFGMPVLEAMACGVPVVSSNTSAIPEVAGDAALLLDPLNSSALGEAMNILLSDSLMLNSYKEKGLARASQFSWEISANKLLQLYSSLG